MRHIAILLFLGSLCAVNFYFFWSPHAARRYFRYPANGDRAIKFLHFTFAVMFLLYMVLVIYSLLNPRGDTR